MEVELKFVQTDHAAVRQALDSLGAKPQEPYFEENWVFDDAEARLRRQGVLLRLRRKPQGGMLTLKQPGPSSVQVKRCAEHQTSVGDLGAMRKVLEGLGYTVVFGYEKVREKWAVQGCEVCLDRLPFGDFVEIEGPESELASLAEKLGLAPESSTSRTYHDLNCAWRAEQGLEPRDGFVFSPEEREQLLKQISSR